MDEGLTPKPVENRCFYCHQPFQYEWYEFDSQSLEDGEPEGYWMEIPCEECMKRRRELGQVLQDMADRGELELDNRDKLLIEEAGFASAPETKDV